MKRRVLFVTGLAATALVTLVGEPNPALAKAPWVKKAQAAGFAEIQNCKSCHTKSSGKELNVRGEFLVAKKTELAAAAVDLQWLKDYKEPPAGDGQPTPEAEPKPNAEAPPEGAPKLDTDAPSKPTAEPKPQAQNE
jgi:hypothetical protein